MNETLTPQQVLTSAFRILQKRSKYYIKDGCSFCSRCKGANLPEAHKDSNIFYHQEGTTVWHLFWTGNGTLIASVLEAVGLTVEWDGTSTGAITATYKEGEE